MGGILVGHDWPTQDDVLAMLLPKARTRGQHRARARRNLEQVLARAEQFHRAIDQPARRRHVLSGGDRSGHTRDCGGEPGDRPHRATQLRRRRWRRLRASALSDDSQCSHWRTGSIRPIRARTLLPRLYVSITHNPVFADNVLYWLLD